MSTAGRREARSNHNGTHDNEGADGNNLNHGEPELDLTEVLHRGQVQRQQRNNHDECWNRLR